MSPNTATANKTSVAWSLPSTQRANGPTSVSLGIGSGCHCQDPTTSRLVQYSGIWKIVVSFISMFVVHVFNPLCGDWVGVQVGYDASPVFLVGGVAISTQLFSQRFLSSRPLPGFPTLCPSCLCPWDFFLEMVPRLRIWDGISPTVGACNSLNPVYPILRGCM